MNSPIKEPSTTFFKNASSDVQEIYREVARLKQIVPIPSYFIKAILTNKERVQSLHQELSETLGRKPFYKPEQLIHMVSAIEPLVIACIERDTKSALTSNPSIIYDVFSHLKNQRLENGSGLNYSRIHELQALNFYAFNDIISVIGDPQSEDTEFTSIELELDILPLLEKIEKSLEMAILNSDDDNFLLNLFDNTGVHQQFILDVVSKIWESTPILRLNGDQDWLTGSEVAKRIIKKYEISDEKLMQELDIRMLDLELVDDSYFDGDEATLSEINELSVEEKIVRVIELHFTDRLLHSDLYFSEFKISRSTSYHRPPLMEYLPESIWMYNRSVNDQTLHTREIETLNAICYARNSEAYLLYRKNRTPYNEWVDDLINEIKDKLKEKRDYLKYANSVDDSPDKSNFIKDVNQDIKYLAYCLRAVTLNKMQILDFFSPSPQ